MKYAILSDIHANLHALNAVLDDSKAQSCTHYVCLGDIVGYGAYPKECVNVIRDMGMPCVKGDYDEYCSLERNLEGFTPRVARVVEWTREQLSEADRDWLRQLPLTMVVDGITLVHAILGAPQRWQYALNKLDAASSFPYQTTTVCFFGHTQMPMAFVRRPMPSRIVTGGTLYTKIQIDRAKKYFVNPGSIGQPRDNNPKAAYATYDLDSQMIEVRRLDYDFGAAQRGIEEAGVPPRFS